MMLFVLFFACQSSAGLWAIPAAELLSLDEEVNGSLSFEIFEDKIEKESPYCLLQFSLEGIVIAEDCSDCVEEFQLELTALNEVSCGGSLANLEQVHWAIGGESNPYEWLVDEEQNWENWGKATAISVENGNGWFLESEVALSVVD